ncbi:MAG: DUF4178 domain-containing protein [Cytophagaceae bacterium]|jgi:hypothetical protein|nr:DUF4178 domain-containing protein [Cytophagaceae bacterium]
MSNSLNEYINEFFYQGHVCPECKKGLTIRNTSTSKYVVCEHCASFLAYNNNKFTLLHTFLKREAPLFPLYSKCTIEHKTYEVISYRYCRDKNEAYYWKEYTLQHPQAPELILTEYQGHWILSKEIHVSQVKKGDSNQIVFNDKKLKLFGSYKILTVNALGEFETNVTSDEGPHYREYVNAPDIITVELNDNGTVYFHGVHISKQEMNSLFPAIQLPNQRGIGSVQPFMKGFSTRWLWMLFGIFSVLLIALQMVFAFTAKNKILIDRNVYLYDSSGFLAPHVSDEFLIEDTYFGTTNLRYSLYANVDNSWFETDVSLVNTMTGQEIQFQQGVEYYHGADYSEGSTNETASLSYIPEGRYKLIATAYRDPVTINPISSYTYRLVQEEVIWINFILILLALLFIPLAMELWKYNFESRRWANSNFGS